MRVQLQMLKESGAEVRFVEVSKSVKDDHWLYDPGSETVYAPEAVAFDAHDLFPEATLVFDADCFEIKH